MDSGLPQSIDQDPCCAKVLPRCSICCQVPAEGIRDVIRVGKAWICGKCEQEIVNLQIGSPKYGLILDKMKRVWR